MGQNLSHAPVLGNSRQFGPWPHAALRPHGTGTGLMGQGSLFSYYEVPSQLNYCFRHQISSYDVWQEIPKVAKPNALQLF